MSETEGHKRNEAETAKRPDLDTIPISRQINLWFGRRHRAEYFISGFVLAALLSWYVFLPTVLDQSRRSYDRIYLDQDMKNQELTETISQLRKTNGLLLDSIATIVNVGSFWGHYRIPIPHGQYSPDIARLIYGRVIRALAHHNDPGFADMELYVDTCVGLIYSGKSTCQPYEDWLPLSINQYTPFGVGDTRFNFKCIDITDSCVALDVYIRENVPH